ARELGTVSGYGEESAPDMRLHVPNMLVDGAEDAKHQGERLGRAEVPIISFATGKLALEVANHIAIQIAASIVQRRGHVLHFIGAEHGHPMECQVTADQVASMIECWVLIGVVAILFRNNS